MDHRVRVPQVIGHEMAGTVAEVGPGVEGLQVGDAVVVRPLDARGETRADRGFSHISRSLKFLGIDTPGAFQTSWTVPAFAVHTLPPGVDLRLAALTEPLAVACHDVRRAELEPNDTAVVIGGGPIGLLIALVAREAGARVALAEVDPVRLDLAAALGLHTVDARTVDIAAHVLERTDGVGADVVFEVSGSPAGALAMTEVAALRGRVVVVAIYPDPQPVRLFDLFWKELELYGARVYEPEDYERAIALVAAGGLPLERLITRVEPLDRLPSLFDEMRASPTGVKTLIDCRA
jgi:2-desacetyl-2-hydroxyethyl bacteriochlorophyllide A dehydrogenase